LGIHFTKLEAIGNDFILVNALGMPELDWPDITVRICDRHFGVGSDGLLVLMRSDKADFRMRMFNPDGCEDMCGNGLRCFVHHIHERGLSEKHSMGIETWDGIRQCEILERTDGSSMVRVNMNKPSLAPADIPANMQVDQVIRYPLQVGEEVFEVTAVQVGSPHAVILMPWEYFRDAPPAVSPLIENHPLFPERINVTWCFVEAPDSLKVRTWERGAGPTLGCGTGATAALIAACVNGLASEYAKVTSPGGTLEIEWPNRGDAFMTGEAQQVFDGVWENGGV